MLTFSSCEKCVTCESKAYVDDVLMSTASTEFCGSSSEIDDYEGSTTSSVGGITTRTEVSCD